MPRIPFDLPEDLLRGGRVAARYREDLLAALGRYEEARRKLEARLEAGDDRELIGLVEELLTAVEVRAGVEGRLLVEALAIHFPGVGPALLEVANALRDPNLGLPS